MIDAAGPWGTGPWILKSGVSQLAKRSPEVVLEPNPNYWNEGRKPTVRVILDNIISQDDAIKSVASGDGKIDVVTMLSPADAKAFKSDKASIVPGKAKTVMVGVLNQNKKNSPWKDQEVRQAINMAIDKEAVVEDGLQGYGTVLAGLIQPGRYGAVDGLEPYSFDPGKAKEILSKAGVKTVKIVGAKSDKPVIDAMTQGLNEAGIEVVSDLSGTPSDDWDIKIVQHFDWSPHFPAGVVFREFFGKDGGFRAMPEDPKFDALYQKILSQTDPAEQEKTTREMEQYEYDQANVIFMASPWVLNAVSNRVEFTPYDTWMLELAETKIKN